VERAAGNQLLFLRRSAKRHAVHKPKRIVGDNYPGLVAVSTLIVISPHRVCRVAWEQATHLVAV